MKRPSLLARAVVLAALALFSFAAPPPRVASAQQMMEGMGRGVVGPMTDKERVLFSDLLCTCGGCQRESIATCTCDFAADRREKVRGWIKSGMSDEQVKAEYVKEYGPEALAVPPNEGSSRLVYIAPLVAIVVMAFVAVTVLKRLRGKDDDAGGDEPKPKPKTSPEQGENEKKSEGERDEYDKRLDDELEEYER